MLTEEEYQDYREDFAMSRGVDLSLVERLTNERVHNLQQRAADYLATEPDQLSQRFREAEVVTLGSHRSLTWRGQLIWVCAVSLYQDGRRWYEIDAIYDSEWMDVADQVTNSELDDLERQLFNLDNLARCGL